MAILNQWGVPFGTALLQAKRQPQLIPVVEIFVELEGTHMDIEIHVYQRLQEYEDDDDCSEDF